jgi:tetratricopeptide (TPR) repeat protein
MSRAPDIAPVLVQLREDLGSRRIRAGIERLEALRPQIESLSPACPDSGTFVGLIAQWVDAGFDSPGLLVKLLARFPASARAALPLAGYLHVRMAEGVVAMSQEDFDHAIAHFRFVQSLENEMADQELMAIANFWTGRCLRKLGRYDKALTYVVHGEQLAIACGYPQMAAITQVTQSWLAFQNGRLDEAIAMLHRAGEALSRTDDYLNRGNIQSAYGRIARRQGRYETAIDAFNKALDEYRTGGGGQLQMARTLQNLAFVKRLRALQDQKELDLIAASRRSGGPTSGQTALLRSRIEQTRTEAAQHLDESMSIYQPHNNHRGIAGGCIIRGFLRLDAGDLECASAEAADAFRHGDEKRDYFVMARARTLQCIIELAAIEEQIGEPTCHREAAAAFARDAVSFAGHTENRRLLARACVWQGLTLASGSDAEREAARRCCEQANSLLQPDAAGQQYVWEELETLRAAVLRAAPVEPQLRAWSAGLVPNTSFQQLTEEFARLVIPKVWEREGRKVSRVAEKLSISPKKIRRILQSVGALK